MPEIRHDALTDRLVIVAGDRAARPETFRRTVEPPPAHPEHCPFCPGHEHETPPEVARLGPGPADEPGWTVRVVPNLYPIVGGAVAGAHEVIVLSPAHDRSFAALSTDAAIDVLRVLRDRAALHLGSGLAHVVPFVNHGRAAGASIEHPHAQLVALDLVPPRAQVRLDRFAPAAFTTDQEHRVVDGAVVVWCPRASPTPFTVRLALADGGSRFDEAADDDARAVGIALRDAIASIRLVIGDAAYNVMIETAPRDHPAPFRWWIDVVPRITITAGFELGTGLSVNIVAPADAAAALRSAG
jgi:UDPglucose--hexose-1-phosphate uridylyltransferase